MIAFSRFIRYFAEVARCGSLRRAAERLHVSASAIDRQILLAEQSYGVKLFERLPAGLRLTTAGELLLDAARRWRVEHERLQAQMTDLVGLRRGHVRIAVIDALARGFLAAEIGRAHAEFPAIRFEVRVLANAEVLAGIAAGEVDFGLMLDPRGSREIVVRAHREVVLGFVLRPDHPLAGRAGLRFSAAVEWPTILPGEKLAVGEQLRALEASTGIALRPVAVSDDIQMLKSLVREGLGLGVLSSIDVMDEVAAGELAFVPITDGVLKPLTLALCVARARQLSAAANLFIARLEAVFAR